MAAKMSAPGLILSFNPYLRSAMVRFPLINDGGDCRIAQATPGLLIISTPSGKVFLPQLLLTSNTASASIF